ncbi:MAG: hypothetical protein DCF15_15445 [Phormidesmis priestleyi]|uniref:SecDF P1 head subdomain domain-containing protein n=1 Tax=Phormidesmis priestleyi TaxID=268141 RepID=A0A2W4X2T2_9CYAN|nr:MAG: hypothetical protein DCF15_15445 [Phormidesmis priestleyi]
MTQSLTQILPRALLTAVVISGVACTTQTKDYTEVTMQASAFEGGAGLNLQSLNSTKAILENRLADLDIEPSEVEIIEPNKILVRLPQTADAAATQALLTSTGQLYLRQQKADTKADLTKGIEELQRLLVAQNTLLQTNQQAEAEALQPQIDRTRALIGDLFEPSQLNSEMLASEMPVEAKAVAGADSHTWDVKIWLNAQGADILADKTKALAGTDRAIGIFLDEVLLSAPLVDAAFAKTGITGGEALIAGSFTREAANILAVQLSNGALPVRLEKVESN